MSNLHLTKVAFACPDLAALRQRIEARSHGGQVRVVTRMRPKRAAELIGGSLYWIVKHHLVARQQILGFEDREDGRVDIICSAQLTIVGPQPRRAHQGWRYFESAERGADESGVAELPPLLFSRLAALALV